MLVFHLLASADPWPLFWDHNVDITKAWVWRFVFDFDKAIWVQSTVSDFWPHPSSLGKMPYIPFLLLAPSSVSPLLNNQGRDRWRSASAKEYFSVSYLCFHYNFNLHAWSTRVQRRSILQILILLELWSINSSVFSRCIVTFLPFRVEKKKQAVNLF